MNAHKANLINAILLIVLSIWGYLDASKPSPTAFIPAVFGIILLACNPGVKKENKVIAHIAVLVTLIALLGLFMPLKGVIGRGNGLGIFRVGTMILSSAFAMVYFVKSFIDARKAREAANQ